MNRRGFISLLAGAAGAPLVPWRQVIEPLIVLPPRLITATGGCESYTYKWSWQQSGEEITLGYCDVTDSRGITVRSPRVTINHKTRQALFSVTDPVNCFASPSPTVII